MDKALRYIGLAVIAFAVGLLVTKFVWPNEITITETEIRYVDRDILRRDTITVTRPEIRTVFRTVKDTARVPVLLPRDFRYAGAISTRPLRFSKGNVVLTYYADSSFVQDRFSIPRPKTSWGLYSFFGLDPFKRAPEFGLEAMVRYRSVTLYGRATAFSGETWTTLGIKIRLKGSE